MKRFFSILLVIFMFTACSKDNHRVNNPNLLGVTVYFTINLTLPEYSNLKFAGNAVYVGGYGNAGVIVVNTGSQNFMAFDAADPNHPLEQCSTLEVNGLEAVCQCSDHNTYNLFTGTAVKSKSGGEDLQYTLLPYQVVNNGNGTLTIQN